MISFEMDQYLPDLKNREDQVQYKKTDQQLQGFLPVE